MKWKPSCKNCEYGKILGNGYIDCPFSVEPIEEDDIYEDCCSYEPRRVIEVAEGATLTLNV